MLCVKPTTHFKKAIKKLSKADLLAVDEALQMLVARKPLPAKYHPHPLQGIFSGFTECHIKPDLLCQRRYYLLDGAWLSFRFIRITALNL